ncbi:MAG TPA: hypothetical protein VMD04_06395 [Candidatus Margulisiibacteriota bacterium]|nr:hypothetical protein [Candidatus Margulisiibacteriota bacterium]
MDRRATTPIILIILIVLILVLAGGGFYLYQKEHAKNLELQDKIEEISTKQRITESKLKDSEKLISELQTKLKESKDQIDTLNNGLQQESSARQEALSKLDQLRADLEQQKNLRADIETRLTQAQDELKGTQTQLRDLEVKKMELEDKVKSLEAETESQRVELGKISVAQETAAALPKGKEQKASQKKQEKVLPPVPEADGKVLVVNKDYNFVVINLGSKDGVKIGDVFSIYHNNKYVGDVKIEKVHDSMAAAGFVSLEIKDKVSEGDKIVQKGR